MRIKLTVSLIITSFISLFSQIVQADKTIPLNSPAFTRLQQMTEASEKSNYEIYFSRNTDLADTSVRYRYVNDNGKKYAQLLYLDGVRQEILQRDNIISYFTPHYPPFSIQGSHIIDELPAVLYADWNQLAKYYDFIQGGKDRVADHIAYVIRILPKDDFRYQYVVWLDENSGLLLRSEILDRNGNILDQFKVIDLTLSDHLKQIITPLNSLTLPPILSLEEERVDNKNTHSTTTTSNPPPTFNWTPSWLPKGFIELNHAYLPGQDLQESRLYSDGLFSFSIYVTNKPIPSSFSGIARTGLNTIYTDNVNGHAVTIIGQIPATTARRVVQDIKFKANAKREEKQ
ncbi:sigma-E factor regulatory protein RseB [Mergibacter septicus]|uniref:MucB/RseB C-terminal domain-containing protein n=1 Tax=Mergibacter septicus TaxID=221402 RepID=UPI0011791A19|nr:MucB/RseB C-terminal domain-containing protein [Mergibacter septicus]AWX13957.1 sigma-E factor regulatory protein RseB [Mergibacter septicus]